MYRIRIRKAPGMQEGGVPLGNQSGFGLRVPVGGNQKDAPAGAGEGAVRSVLPPVDRSVANIEAEKGETVWGDFDGDNFPEHYKIGGERHSNGGTPLQVPEGSFVFSDTKKLKIGGPVLKEFGKDPDSKKKYTFAQLAKQYDVNPFKVLLKDPQSDRTDRDTAELMLDNYQRKLAKLALIQEGMKGFPQGIPSIAAPLFDNEEGQGMPQAERGGLVKAQLGRWVQSAPAMVPGYPQINPFSPWFAPPSAPAPANPRPVMASAPVPGYWLQPHEANFNPQQGWTPFSSFSQYNPAPATQPELEEDVHPAPLPNAGRIPNSVRKDARNAESKKEEADDARTRRLYEYSFNPNADGSTVYPGYISKEQNADVPWTQHVRANGTYGTRDWDMTDFYQRHPWVKQQRPNFDPRNENDVKWFQNAYNEHYRDIWGYNYFNGKGHLKIDGKFGQGTYSTPALTEGTATQSGTTPAAGQDKTKEDEKKQGNSLHPNSFNSSGQQDDQMPWWAQDRINYGAAYRNRYDLHKYMPSYVNVDAVLPNAVYYDPTRALASNQEAAAAQSLLSSLYAGPQRLRAVGSNIQGQGAGLAANILGDYNNRNVAVANQLAGIRAEIRNNVGFQRAKAIDDFLAKNTIANQQYDNSVHIADNDVRNNLVNGMTNAQKTYWLNRMNPYYNINPESGALYFKSGKSLNQGNPYGGGGDSMALYKANYDKFKKAFPNADDDKALEYAQKMTFGNKGAFNANGDVDLTNPMVMSILNQYG